MKKIIMILLVTLFAMALLVKIFITIPLLTVNSSNVMWLIALSPIASVNRILKIFCSIRAIRVCIW